MAPYGVCEVARSTARSNAQFEAERFRKEISKEKEAMSKVLSKEKEACSKVLSNEKEACSSSDFERSVASKHARAVISIARWPRRKKKHARALISSAQWPQSTLRGRSDDPKSKLEQ